MAHVATITIDHTKVPGDLTDYVGLIVPDGSAGYSALYALCLEGGGDIRLFKSDDTTELAREIVSFSVTSETGEIHYKYAGTLSSSVDTDIHVYADGSSADYAVTATYGRNNVWSAYEVVTHLQSDGTDSSGNLTATNTGVTFSAGKIGGEAVSNANDDRITYGTPDLFSGTKDFTLSFWVRYTGGGLWMVSQRDNVSFNWQFVFNAGALYFQPSRTTNVFFSDGITIDSTRQLLTVVRESTSSWKLYKNGSLVATASLSTSIGTGQVFSLFRTNESGNTAISGGIDEFRAVDSTAKSANWITAEYNNQNSPSTFYSVAAVAGGSAAQAARRGAVMMM